jgi:hypothetical protein
MLTWSIVVVGGLFFCSVMGPPPPRGKFRVEYPWVLWKQFIFCSKLFVAEWNKYSVVVRWQSTRSRLLRYEHGGAGA